VVLELKRRGRTVLLTTHYMDEAEKLCDRIAIVDHGKVISQGTPRELIATLGGSEVIDLALEGEAPDDLPQRLSALPGAHAARKSADGFMITVEQLHLALPAVLALLESSSLKLQRLATHHATLEDVFVSLTGRALRE
jgi:ABC-2 type transport system ATP-binding protein